MNFKFLIFLFFLFPIISIAQVESTNYKAVSTEFENSYNAEKFSRIFNLFSKRLQEQLPPDKTIEYFDGVLKKAGKIVSHQFIGFDANNFAVYKTQFQKKLYAINLFLDKENKIQGIVIQPFDASKIKISNVKSSSSKSKK